MKHKNVALNALFTAFLLAEPVESAGMERSKSAEKLIKWSPKLSPLSETPKIPPLKDQTTSPYENRNAKKHSPILSAKPGTTLVPMEDPIAHSSKGQRFKEALQRGDVYTARGVFDSGNDELKRYGGKHLVSLGSIRIVELINGVERDCIKAWVLQVLLIYAEQLLIGTVFDAIKPSNDLLRHVAEGAELVELVCVPQNFTYLLGRMVGKKYQEDAVKYGVRVLFSKNKTECLVPLLNALGGGAFLSDDLENIAIGRAFWKASSHQDARVLYTMRFFDHPAVSISHYSTALYESYERGDQAKKLFYWLLERADRRDLEAVKRYDVFYKKEPEFQQIVNQALLAVGSETRHETGRQKRIALIEEVIKSDTSTIILKLIGEYIE